MELVRFGGSKLKHNLIIKYISAWKILYSNSWARKKTAFSDVIGLVSSAERQVERKKN